MTSVKRGVRSVSRGGVLFSYMETHNLFLTECFQELARSLAKQGIRRLLVFANLRDLRYFGAFFSGVRGTGVECTPQLLGEIAYHLLTVTTVYLEFRQAVFWETPLQYL